MFVDEFGESDLFYFHSRNTWDSFSCTSEIPFKRIKDSVCLASVGRLFQALIDDDKKEFEYKVVRANIDCKLSELYKLYLEVFPAR